MMNPLPIVAAFGLIIGSFLNVCIYRLAPISPIYPVVEILTALAFVAVWALTEPGVLLASRLVFACAMIVLAFIDLRHRILPNSITVPGIVAGLAASLFGPPGLVAALIGAAAGGGVLLLIAWIYERVRHQEGLGMGDVKMLAMIGAFLGWKLMLLTLVLSSLLGSAVGVALIVLAKGDMKHALPFGTFLAAGALVASLFGDAVITWYLGFY